MWILFFSLVACKETIEPNGIWSVRIEGLGTDCVASPEGFLQTYEYALYYDGSYVEIKVDGDSFATGQIRGCSLIYESGVYLEESEDGDFRWQINGSADVESAAGGCDDIPDSYDWYGNIPYDDPNGEVPFAGEVLTVVSSENESVEAGCEYMMEVTGTYLQ